MRQKIKQVLQDKAGSSVEVKGWVRTVRHQKQFSFVEVNDGSTQGNLQVIVESTLSGYEELVDTMTTGCAISVVGILAESPGQGQSLELKASNVQIIGECDATTYPLQKKRHSFEFLRTIAHLRPRTNTQGAVARIRNALFFATHRFFQSKGFLFLPSPIITASDCEGAGEMFRVTTIDPANPPKTPEGEIDYSKDFFSTPAFLTVSGQLNGEIYALAFSDVYTFGPTFRAENSNTSRHLAEFWMIEPELAFADLRDNMANAEEYLKFVTRAAMEECPEELAFCDQFIENGLIDRLQKVVDTPFAHMTYSEAITCLEKSGKTFEFPVSWGLDLQSEHERYLAEEHCKGPLILTDYPKEIKAFYMRENTDGKTVAAMDVLVPRIGEVIGGSQREERYDVLMEKIKANGLDPKSYWWYLELRKYGSAPHSGYGVGFERLLGFVTGVENIRDLNPFPRYPQHALF